MEVKIMFIKMITWISAYDFGQNNLSSVPVLGDSNRRCYYNAMMKFIQQIGWSYAIVKQENLTKYKLYNVPDTLYYVREPTIKLSNIIYQTRMSMRSEQMTTWQ